MAEEHPGPSGPDLRQGIPAESVPDGGMVTGQADGEAVLLVAANQSASRPRWRWSASPASAPPAPAASRRRGS